MRRALTWLAIAVVVVAGVALAGGFRRSTPVAGKRAPALPAAVLVAPRVDLAALRGKPAVVNFWASWCGPCRREAPELERFGRSLGGRGRLVGVNWNDSAGGARSFIRRYHWTFPNLRDGEGTVGNAYDIAGLPTTFVLDRDGRIRRKLPGPQSVASIDRALRTVGG